MNCIQKWDKNHIQIAIFSGETVAQRCIQEHLSCLDALKQMVAVSNCETIEEGLYKKEGQLIGVIHGNSTDLTILQLLALVSMPHCQTKPECSELCLNFGQCQEAIDLQLVAFMESFKQTCDQLTEQAEYTESWVV